MTIVTNRSPREIARAQRLARTEADERAYAATLERQQYGAQLAPDPSRVVPEPKHRAARGRRVDQAIARRVAAAAQGDAK